jgi:hypothetical protein
VRRTPLYRCVPLSAASALFSLLGGAGGAVVGVLVTAAHATQPWLAGARSRMVQHRRRRDDQHGRHDRGHVPGVASDPPVPAEALTTPGEGRFFLGGCCASTAPSNTPSSGSALHSRYPAEFEAVHTANGAGSPPPMWRTARKATPSPWPRPLPPLFPGPDRLDRTAVPCHRVASAAVQGRGQMKQSEQAALEKLCADAFGDGRSRHG